MNALIQQLIANGPVLTDGAWGTQMQARGLPIGACPEAWNLSKADCVEEVARAYIAAGSRIILTNTFGANRIALRRHGLEEHADQICCLGAALSRKAADPGAFVFASMGPTGPGVNMGDVPIEDVMSAFEHQARKLAEGGADALVIETMSDLSEARIALEAAKETRLPVVACMSYGTGKDGDRTMTGVTPERAAEELQSAGADVIGANCGFGAPQMLSIVRRMRAATRLPLWIKPNAGLPEWIDGQAVYRTTPEEFAESCLALVDAGADFIGGCCGATPNFIRALHKSLTGQS
jgi:5-methyltetrahydrofolate--homocysteine methyltransferase